MSVQLEGAITGLKADVNSSNELKVVLAKDPTAPVPMYLVGKADVNASTITGSITGSTQGLLGSGVVQVEQEENFSGSGLSTSKWQSILTTMTTAQSANGILLNNGNSTASGAVATIRGYRYVKCYRAADRIIAWRVALTAAPVAGTVVEIGAFQSTTTSDPTAGCGFRYTASQTLVGFSVTQSGTEVQTSAITMTTPTSNHDYLIVIGHDSIIFEIDDIPVAAIPIPTSAASPLAGESAPPTVRVYNSVLTATPQSVTINRFVSANFGGDMGADKYYTAALAGDFGAQHGTNTGATGGQTTNYTNSTAPTSATLSNTAAGYTTLGGLYQFAAVAGAATDYALFAFQVPIGSFNATGRTLVIHGVRIHTVNTGAANSGVTPTVMTWSLGVGATGVSLATTETVTSKATRRIPLGIQSMPTSSAIGFAPTELGVDFKQPLSVNPGEYVHAVLRVTIGAATGSQIIQGSVYIDATWE